MKDLTLDKREKIINRLKPIIAERAIMSAMADSELESLMFLKSHKSSLSLSEYILKMFKMGFKKSNYQTAHSILEKITTLRQAEAFEAFLKRVDEGDLSESFLGVKKELEERIDRKRHIVFKA